MKAILIGASAAVCLLLIAVISFGVGIVYGPALSAYSMNQSSMSESADQPMMSKGSDEPMYWVAPMDPNYRRDGPGKSPMGMDLVPVYDKGGEDLPAGTVEISPTVINSLGVRTAFVERASLNDTIETVGYIGYDKRQLEEIHSRVAGWLRQLNVRADGDPVEQGAPLYAIYSPELVAAQEEYLVAVRSRDRLFISASREKLANLGINDDTIERIRNSGTAESQVSVLAPQTGVVDSLAVGQGAYVTPGQRLMRIAGMDPVWVEGEVFESQLSKLSVGAAVIVEMDGVPGRQWTGTVDTIYPVLNSMTRTARMRVVLENADRALLPNMFARLRIAMRAAEPELLVERDAVLRSGNMDRVVLAMGDGRFKSVKVKTGLSSREQVQILEGLEDGDEVVVSAQFLIDSESSIASDFKRMSEPEPPPESVWAIGVVDDIYADEGIAAITHEPIPEWDWPTMSMEFAYDEAIDIDKVSAGVPIRFRMSKTPSGEYRIDELEVSGEARTLR